MEYKKNIQIRWSDLDPNFHVLHSKYYDFGAYCRMAFLVEHGLTPALMNQYHFGPILFREECVFRKEIGFGEDISIDLKIKSVSADFSRWSMQHHILKGGTVLSAVIQIDGAWIDTKLRKLTTPPAEVLHIFDTAPKTDDFIITGKLNK